MLSFITIIILCAFSSTQASTDTSTSISPVSSSGVIKSMGQNDSTDDPPPHPNLNPDPEQTKKAVETILSSNRKDILVWRTELAETQKYFNKLKVQNFKEEEISKTEDTVFRQWADKTEERMSKLFSAMATRLSELDNNNQTTTTT